MLLSLSVSRKVVFLWSRAYRTGPRCSTVYTKDAVPQLPSYSQMHLLISVKHMSGLQGLYSMGRPKRLQKWGHGDYVWSSFIIKHHVIHICYHFSIMISEAQYPTLHCLRSLNNRKSQNPSSLCLASPCLSNGKCHNGNLAPGPEKNLKSQYKSMAGEHVEHMDANC